MKKLFIIRHAKSSWKDISKKNAKLISFDYPKKIEENNE